MPVGMGGPRPADMRQAGGPRLVVKRTNKPSNNAALAEGGRPVPFVPPEAKGKRTRLTKWAPPLCIIQRVYVKKRKRCSAELYGIHCFQFGAVGILVVYMISLKGKSVWQVYSMAYPCTCTSATDECVGGGTAALYTIVICSVYVVWLSLPLCPPVILADCMCLFVRPLLVTVL
jgi:hypothetical protein